MTNSHSGDKGTTPLKPRKAPKQPRSAYTVDVILEGAAHILESAGLSEYNTNRIAERAGVSIGSLYQYFPSKDAVTIALIDREEKKLVHDVLSALSSPDIGDAMRGLIKAAVNYQLKRPALSKLLDNEETRLAKTVSNSENAETVRTALKDFFTQNNTNPLIDPTVATLDVMEITRCLTDIAGRRAHVNPENLQHNIERAVFGYLGIKS